MKQKMKTYDVGVIVGRFQIGELHEGHQALIQGVVDSHTKTIVFLGLSQLICTINNPLDFEMRKQMILEKFPDVNVLYARDMSSDEVWSKNLDDQIATLVSPTQSVALYGSRDSFISRYHGKYDTIELEPEYYSSATEERKRDGKRVKNSPEFRKGVIWATQNRFPTCYTTVDVAIIDPSAKIDDMLENNSMYRVLLGRKEGESKYRFIGGFSSPEAESFESDANREVIEETGLECADYRYIGSYKIDDWRYRAETDKIKTLFFIATYVFGRPEAKDDIAEVRWFELGSLKKNQIIPAHHVLYDALMKYCNVVPKEEDITEGIGDEYVPQERSYPAWEHFSNNGTRSKGKKRTRKVDITE